MYWIKHIETAARRLLYRNPEPASGDLLQVARDGGGVGIIDLEPYQPAPRRRKAAPRLLDIPGFAAYVNRHKTADTLLFFDPSEVTCRAVFDHLPERAGSSWREHCAVLDIAATPEFQRWSRFFGEYHKQRVVADFLEENDYTVIRPSGAELLEMVEQFEQTSTVRFEARSKRKDGARVLTYSEENDTGTLTIPDSIRLRLYLYEASPEPIELDVLLRYRIGRNAEDRGLTFRFAPHRLDEHLTQEAERIAREISKQTDLPALLGVDG